MWQPSVSGIFWLCFVFCVFFLFFFLFGFFFPEKMQKFNRGLAAPSNFSINQKVDRHSGGL